MIKLSKKELQIVKSILKNYVPNLKILLFGSRVNGNTHEYSDLDIAIKGTDKIDILLLANIKDEFQNSDLPFRVDVIDFNRASPEFQKIVMNSHLPLKLD